VSHNINIYQRRRIILILPADKGNCTVVLDKSKYNDKINTLLESGVYEPLPKDPTAKFEMKV
jgi:hypothetical protein